MSSFLYPFIPAKAGTQADRPIGALADGLSATQNLTSAWVPAFAGMNGSWGMNGMKGQRS